MDSLPKHLLDKVLFKTDLRALAMLRCTNTSLRSHIRDPSFVCEYYSQIRPSLIYIPSFGSKHLGCHHPHHEGSRSALKTKYVFTRSHILGYCSGLVLLFMHDRLCVANPYTKKFRFLALSDARTRSVRYDSRNQLFTVKKGRNQLGFAVNQIDPDSKSFKVVYLFERESSSTHETRYGFEIISGNRNLWTCSKTTLTCHSSDLDRRMKSPVYLDGSFHWLRNDGSIVAFNPETEKARLIQTELPNIGLGSATLFEVDNNSLTLVSNKEEVTYIYALKNILRDPKWFLVKQIQNEVTVKDEVKWNVGAYNGKYLVLGSGSHDRLVQVYDLIANKWVDIGSIPVWCDPCQDFFLFTPSHHRVVGLDEILGYWDKRISTLSSIMTLVDPSSPENRPMKMSGD